MNTHAGQAHRSERQRGDDEHDEGPQDRQPQEQVAEVRIALVLLGPAFPQFLDPRVIQALAVRALRRFLRVPLTAALTDLALSDPDGKKRRQVHELSFLFRTRHQNASCTVAASSGSTGPITSTRRLPWASSWRLGTTSLPPVKPARVSVGQP